MILVSLKLSLSDSSKIFSPSPFYCASYFPLLNKENQIEGNKYIYRRAAFKSFRKFLILNVEEDSKDYFFFVRGIWEKKNSSFDKEYVETF